MNRLFQTWIGVGHLLDKFLLRRGPAAVKAVIKASSYIIFRFNHLHHNCFDENQHWKFITQANLRNILAITPKFRVWFVRPNRNAGLPSSSWGSRTATTTSTTASGQKRSESRAAPASVGRKLRPSVSGLPPDLAGPEFAAAEDPEGVTGKKMSMVRLQLRHSRPLATF